VRLHRSWRMRRRIEHRFPSSQFARLK
jgi:hypothetical protein